MGTLAIIATALSGIIVALLGLTGGLMKLRHDRTQSILDGLGKLIDQLQEENSTQRAQLAGQGEKIDAINARVDLLAQELFVERLYSDQLVAHINKELGPPAPSRPNVVYSTKQV